MLHFSGAFLRNGNSLLAVANDDLVERALMAKPADSRLKLQTDWPVVVVGAGPAGSMTAYLLARRGIRVLLLDKAAFPRSKTCGSCLGGLALSVLSASGLGQLPAESGAEPIESIRLIRGKNSAKTSIGKRVALSRSVLDTALINRARAAGVEVCLSARATVGPVNDDHRTVEVSHASKSTQLKASFVVLASGLASGFPSDSGIQRKVAKTSRVGVGAVLPNLASLANRRELAMVLSENGYTGIVRTDGNALDVASAFDATYLGRFKQPADAVANAVRQFSPHLAEEIKAHRFVGTPLLSQRPSRVSAERLALVGDAAGYVEPFTGEGIGWAMLGASRLAQLLTEGFACNSVHAVASAWERAYRHAIKPRQRICRIASRALRSSILCRLAIAGLRMSPRLARPVVSVIDHAA